MTMSSPSLPYATSSGSLPAHQDAAPRGQKRLWSARRLFNRASSDRPMGEMNTTPLIDVMLVLLVMFIITVPIQTHSVKVDLPVHTDVTEPDPVKNKITIDANNVLAWNGQRVDQRRLAVLLTATKAYPVQPELQFQPDPLARYIVVDETLATIKRAEVRNLGFIGNEHYTKVF